MSKIAWTDETWNGGCTLDLKPGSMPITGRREWPPEPSILEVAIDALGMTFEAVREALDAPGGYDAITLLLEDEPPEEEK